jgi:Dolichyl-phosphate-mannose-protein mannosyltransferase
MKALLTLLSLFLFVGILLAVPPLVAPYAAEVGTVTVFDTAKAILLCSVLAALAGYFASRQGANGTFLVKLFVGALLVRLLVGTVIFAFNGLAFFGGDAITYDYYGLAELKGWGGDRFAASIAATFVGQGEGAGWGMIYFVAAVYALVGRNLLAVQFVNSVLGATTPVIIFLCARHVYGNERVARIAGYASAFYPSLVLWSSQGLKDGPVVFMLALSILATLKLGTKFSLPYLIALIACLFSLLSLRFYVFYMLIVAVGGAFLIGTRGAAANSLLRRFVVIVLLGLSLTYLGITRYANLTFQRYGSLEQVQLSRLDASTTARSGFARDVDVSTTQGAISTIPVGLLYLLFAPFPWQLASLRQSITLPEMIVWWVSFPMLVTGLWFSLRYRLRMISPIAIFTVMLSLAYSVFQGNVGTAYRQRSQLLVFYFIFTAVGYVLVIEKREEKRKSDLVAKQAAADARDSRIAVIRESGT